MNIPATSLQIQGLSNDVDGFVNFLNENESLRKLDLRLNDLRSVSITTLLPYFDGLICLNLRKCCLDNLYAISRWLMENRMLRDLDVSKNPLGNESVRQLFGALLINDRLEMLNLSGIRLVLNSEMAECFQNTFAVNEGVIFLDLEELHFSDIESILLGEAVRASNTLEKIDLRLNAFTNVGKLALHLAAKSKVQFTLMI